MSESSQSDLDFWIELDRLILKEAGKFPMDLNTVHNIATWLRSNPEEELEEAILVRYSGAVIGGRHIWIVMEGRHRFFGSVIAGRRIIRARLDS